MFIKMLQQQVGLKDALDAAKGGQDTNKEVEELEDLGQTPDIGLSVLLEESKEFAAPMKKGCPPVEVPKVQNPEKPAEQDIPKVVEILKPSSNQAVPLPIPSTLPAVPSSAPQTTATVVATPAPTRTPIPGIEALVSLMQKRPDNSVKMVPVKVLSVDTGKEAVIPVQEKHSSSLLASLHNVLQENAPPSVPSGGGAAIAAVAAQTLAAPIPVVPKTVTAVALSTVPKSMEPTGPIASVVATPILSAGVPISLPVSLATVATNPAPVSAVNPAPSTAAPNPITAPAVVTSVIPPSLISSMSVSDALVSAAVGYGSNVKVSFLKGKEAVMEVGGTNAR